MKRKKEKELELIVDNMNIRKENVDISPNQRDLKKKKENLPIQIENNKKENKGEKEELGITRKRENEDNNSNQRDQKKIKENLTSEKEDKEIDVDVIALNLFKSYSDGNIEMDEEEEKELTIKLANTGNEIGLAFKYCYGFDCQSDYKKSCEYFWKYLKSNEQDENKKQIISYCLFVIYNLFDYGKGKEKGVKKNDLLIKSAEMGNKEALFNLGGLVREGVKGFSKNEEKGIEYLVKSSNMGCIDSITSLYNIYEGKRDYIKMILYLNKARELKDYDGMYKLAEIYLNGIYVNKDVEKAIQIYSESAGIEMELTKKGGEMENEINLFLAEVYENGEIVKKDLQKAFHYYLNVLQILNGSEGHEDYLLKVKKLIKTGEVKWNERSHRYWTAGVGLKKELVTLLLIAKYKNSSRFKVFSFFLKGIMSNIISFLVSFHQVEYHKNNVDDDMDDDDHQDDMDNDQEGDDHDDDEPEELDDEDHAYAIVQEY